MSYRQQYVGSGLIDTVNQLQNLFNFEQFMNLTDNENVTDDFSSSDESIGVFEGRQRTQSFNDILNDIRSIEGVPLFEETHNLLDLDDRYSGREHYSNFTDTYGYMNNSQNYYSNYSSLGSSPLSDDLFLTHSFTSNSSNEYGFNPLYSHANHATDEFDPELEISRMISNNLSLVSKYSGKVFIGGIPDGLCAGDLRLFFSRFGESAIDWPHRSDPANENEYPKGYAFVIFVNADSVESLINACTRVDKRYCMDIRTPGSTCEKTIQIRPWHTSNVSWKIHPDLAIDLRYSVFIGGIPRIATAEELAIALNEHIGDVIMVHIEVDRGTEYPQGAARAVFIDRNAYAAAINRRHMVIDTCGIRKTVEMKPFYDEGMICEQCRRVPGNRLCPWMTCLQYFCDSCWHAFHCDGPMRQHEPMQKRSYLVKPMKSYRTREERYPSRLPDYESLELDISGDPFDFPIGCFSSDSLCKYDYGYPRRYDDYSTKVFLGGLPDKITASDLTLFFSRFGRVTVDWPHRESSDFPRAGYAFLIFSDVIAVRSLLSCCLESSGKYTMKINVSDSYVGKIVQVKPWKRNDSFWTDPTFKLDHDRYTLFLGGVPRTLTAATIATILRSKIGPVASVTVELEDHTGYPKGVARVVMRGQLLFDTAVAAKFITITPQETDHAIHHDKQVEIKRYNMDSTGEKAKKTSNKNKNPKPITNPR